MDLDDLFLKTLGIEKSKYGKIYSFVDFGNVNYWFEKDERDWNGDILQKNEKLVIGIEKLSCFINLFTLKSRFYFGIDQKAPKSIKIISLARDSFDKVVTKDIQRIKHYLEKRELQGNTRVINSDLTGNYVYIPKCNFDVEICIDAIRFIDQYDTFCLFTSDSDFKYLLEFIKRRGKNIVLFSAGYVQQTLKDKADLNINAQRIKKNITFIKQKPRLKGEILISDSHPRAG